MARPKGVAKTGGRVAGTPNRVTKALKDMILGALDDVGGQEYLKRQAEENPVAFMTLLGKVLPSEMSRIESKIDELTKEQRDKIVDAAKY